MVRTSAVIWATIAFSVASTLAVPMAIPQWDASGLARRSGVVDPQDIVVPPPKPTPTARPKL